MSDTVQQCSPIGHERDNKTQENSDLSTLASTYLTRQPTYVQRNIEARSCHLCYSGKAISITYCARLFVA
jgi:hypothetical protein